MPSNNSQTGALPFIALVIVVPILLIISFVIIFSTGGINFSSSPNSTPIPTQRPEPSHTPKPKGASTFVKVDLTIDLVRNRTIYCDIDAAQNVQSESDNLLTQLQKSELCLNSYSQYDASQSAKLSKCLATCDSDHKIEIKKCNDDFDEQLYGEYDLVNCTNDSDKKHMLCKEQCNVEERVLTVPEYNTNCRTPSVDQSFRVDDLVKQYCQDHP
jgi:hypothetical protein